ncbi:TPA: hypothetical protein ACKRYD_002911 [Providencia stuartii]
MGIEYFFADGRGRNEGAFDHSAVDIDNPHVPCTVELLRKLRCFPLKKMAKEWCEQWNVDCVRIVKLRTRFQEVWVIDLGRNRFVPEFAEGYLTAKCFNKTFIRAERC